MNKEENKDRCKAYYKAHREERKSYYKAHREKRKEYQKTYYETHKDEKKIYDKDYIKSYMCIEINSSKHKIRSRSNFYLFTTLKHPKLKGYEIHHCFGYEDYKCFIYIPKELHLQIHQYLRDNGISADSNHFSQIVHLINEWDGYTYIKV